MPPEFSRAFRTTIPVLFAYLPLGAAFGLLFGALHLPWFYAALSGLIVYAGAAQFLSVGLLAARASLTEIFVATLLLNMRHVFYGFSFFHRFTGSRWAKAYMIFGLTDETYSVLTSHPSENSDQDRRFCLYVTALNQFYWVLGCGVGSILERNFHIENQGFEFVLTALFTVLTVEQALRVRRKTPFLLATVGAAFAIRFFPNQMLLVSLILVSFGLMVSYRWGKAQ